MISGRSSLAVLLQPNGLTVFLLEGVVGSLLLLGVKSYDAFMAETSFEKRSRYRQLDRVELQQHQLQKLNQLVAAILPDNPFYADKLAAFQFPLESLDSLQQLPLTSKEELLRGVAAGGTALNRTYPLEQYVRFHRTSGTRGQPWVVLDTAADWQWFVDTWQYVLDVAEVTAADQALLAFSFGPFIGFWSAHEATAARGTLVVPGGGLSTLGRLELIKSQNITVLLCTPTYALHMAEVARENKIDLSESSVRCVIVAGEPGGSIPAVRQRIETAWNARLVDHAGATEVGPWGYADAEGEGLHVIESEFLAEFISLTSGQPAEEGELSELVLTNFGRTGNPVIRYRTGDLVRPVFSGKGADRFVFLPGGVLGRSDEMIIIRGVNVFPSSVEQIVRSFPEIVEYRLTVRREGELDQLLVEIEDSLSDAERVAEEFQLRLGLRVAVECVPEGTLPRFEAKGKRFVDERPPAGSC